MRQVQSAIRENGPFPEEALFLGIGEDTLPVLLNTNDPDVQAIMVYGEPNRVHLLQTAYHAALLCHPGVQIVAVNCPFAKPDNRVVSYRAMNGSASTLFSSMSDYVRMSRTDNGSHLPLRLILLNDYDELSVIEETRVHLKTIIRNGSRCNFWVIASATTLSASFRTQIEAVPGGFVMQEGRKNLFFTTPMDKEIA